MAELVVIGYPAESEAEEVMGVLRSLERDRVIVAAGSAVVVRTQDGDLHVATPTHATGVGAPSGGLWGMLIGRLFFMPPGGSTTSDPEPPLFNQMTGLGIDDEFKANVTSLLTPGRAAVVMLFEKQSPARTIDALAPYGGTVLKTSLSREADLHLRDATTAARSATAPA
jgi:uncharacterized membrane protein